MQRILLKILFSISIEALSSQTNAFHGLHHRAQHNYVKRNESIFYSDFHSSLTSSGRGINSNIQSRVSDLEYALDNRRSISHSTPWQRNFNDLKSFQQKNGHCNVPRKESSLGNWVQKQRSGYKLYIEQKKGSNGGRLKSNQAPLTEEKVQALNSIGFIWDIHEFNFQLRLNRLQVFFQEHGHIDVPSTSNGEIKLLYKWLCRQKKEYKKYLSGSDSNLTNDRRQSLEKLGFHIGMFDIVDTSEKRPRKFIRKSWEEQFEELVKFKKKYNHCMVPNRDKEYAKLSGWVQHQRAEKKKKASGSTSRLSDDQVKRLDEIGFVWNIQDKVWNERLKQLKDFKSKHGHVRIPTKSSKLGNWVMIQRQQYGLKMDGKKNTLSDERVKALESLDFEWDIREVCWEEKFNELKECILDETSTINDPYLKSWIAVQRAEMKYKQKGLQSHLSDQREAKLNQIGFDWNISFDRNEERRANWIENFERLKQFKKENGTCRVPVRKLDSKEEKRFSHWVRDQRKYYKARVQGLNAPMNEDRRNLLESIGFADDL